MMRKKELRAAMQRFFDDKNRVISERMLAELAGLSIDTIKNVFKFQITELTPTTQIRLEKALKAIENGDVVVTEAWNRVRNVGYRRKPQPEFKRGLSLTLKDGKIGIRARPVNANCYTEPTFREEFER